MLKTFPLDKINSKKKKTKKKLSFFFLDLQLLTVLLLICDSYELKHQVRLCKTVCGILQSLYFCVTKWIDSLILKRHDSFQN